LKEESENVEDDEKRCRPRSPRTDEYFQKVQNLLHPDRGVNIRGVTMQLILDKETVREILSDNFGMKSVSAKMVRQLLTECQAVSGPKIDY
jgi:hypothetical protein